MKLLSYNRQFINLLKMYAKNSIGSLGKLHSNVLMKSQSPSILRYKPLS